MSTSASEAPLTTNGDVPGALLEVRGLKKYFPVKKGILIERTVGEVKAVDDVSFDVYEGKTLGLVGESGSGKTTFLSILGCLLTPTSGRLEIEGAEVDPGRPDRLWRFRRESIGFVFQQFNLFPSLTAAENIEYALNIKGHRGRGARDEAIRWLEVVGLADRVRFRPRDLSGKK